MSTKFNPCVLFNTALLEAMLQKGLQYFVRSSFPRGEKNSGEKPARSFLVSHYHKPAEAQRHFQAIGDDPFRFLYDARRPGHLDKLRKAAAQPEGYRVWSVILVPGIEKKITRFYRDNTRRWIGRHTRWELKGGIRLIPFLYFQLGELFTRIAYEGEEIKIKFEELENA